MKKTTNLFALAIALTAFSFASMAQSPNMGINGNYKHQYPISKGNSFKKATSNVGSEDLSNRNYKRQNRKEVTNTGTNLNVTTSRKSSAINSKHPYGL